MKSSEEKFERDGVDVGGRGGEENGGEWCADVCEHGPK